MGVKEQKVLGKYQVWQPYLDSEQKESNNEEQFQCEGRGCRSCGGCGHGCAACSG